MTETTLVALLSGDLMFGSQLEAALVPARIMVANTADPEMLHIDASSLDVARDDPEPVEGSLTSSCLRPMNRLMENTVFSGLVTACRLAT